DPDGRARRDMPDHEPARFKLLEPARQHSVADCGQALAQLAEAQGGALLERCDDQPVPRTSEDFHRRLEVRAEMVVSVLLESHSRSSIARSVCGLHARKKSA